MLLAASPMNLNNIKIFIQFLTIRFRCSKAEQKLFSKFVCSFLSRVNVSKPVFKGNSLKPLKLSTFPTPVKQQVVEINLNKICYILPVEPPQI